VWIYGFSRVLLSRKKLVSFYKPGHKIILGGAGAKEARPANSVRNLFGSGPGGE